MKKYVLSLPLMIILFGYLSLCADQSDDTSAASNLVQLRALGGEQSIENSETRRNLLGGNEDLLSRKAFETYSTNLITSQYTNDGWLQHVAIYQDCVIATNITGPREGLQLIVASNGALIDMCHTCTKHKNYFVNKYSWGEVISYVDQQIVNVKKK